MLLDKDVIEDLPAALQRYYELWEKYPKLNVQMRTIRDFSDKVPEARGLEECMTAIETISDSRFRLFLSIATNFYEWSNRRSSMLVTQGQSNNAQRCYMPLLEVVVRPNG